MPPRKREFSFWTKTFLEQATTGITSSRFLGEITCQERKLGEMGVQKVTLTGDKALSGGGGVCTGLSDRGPLWTWSHDVREKMVPRSIVSMNEAGWGGQHTGGQFGRRSQIFKGEKGAGLCRGWIEVLKAIGASSVH